MDSEYIHEETEPVEVENLNEQLENARVERDHLEEQLCSIEKRRLSEQQQEDDKSNRTNPRRSKRQRSCSQRNIKQEADPSVYFQVNRQPSTPGGNNNQPQNKVPIKREPMTPAWDTVLQIPQPLPTTAPRRKTRVSEEVWYDSQNLEPSAPPQNVRRTTRSRKVRIPFDDCYHYEYPGSSTPRPLNQEVRRSINNCYEYEYQNTFMPQNFQEVPDIRNNNSYGHEYSNPSMLQKPQEVHTSNNIFYGYEYPSTSRLPNPQQVVNHNPHCYEYPVNSSLPVSDHQQVWTSDYNYGYIDNGNTGFQNSFPGPSYINNHPGCAYLSSPAYTAPEVNYENHHGYVYLHNSRVHHSNRDQSLMHQRTKFFEEELQKQQLVEDRLSSQRKLLDLQMLKVEQEMSKYWKAKLENARVERDHLKEQLYSIEKRRLSEPQEEDSLRLEVKAVQQKIKSCERHIGTLQTNLSQKIKQAIGEREKRLKEQLAPTAPTSEELNLSGVRRGVDQLKAGNDIETENKLLFASLKEQDLMRTIDLEELVNATKNHQKKQLVNERLFSSLKESLEYFDQESPLEVLLKNFDEQLKNARVELDHFEEQLCSIEKRRPSEQQEKDSLRLEVEDFLQKIRSHRRHFNTLTMQYKSQFIELEKGEMEKRQKEQMEKSKERNLVLMEENKQLWDESRSNWLRYREQLEENHELQGKLMRAELANLDMQQILDRVTEAEPTLMTKIRLEMPWLRWSPLPKTFAPKASSSES